MYTVNRENTMKKLANENDERIHKFSMPFHLVSIARGQANILVISLSV